MRAFRQCVAPCRADGPASGYGVVRRGSGAAPPAGTGGDAVSSAILYFAIVAIWAGVLMPRWLRPGRRRRYEVTEHFEMHTEVYETEAMPRIRGQKPSQPAVTEREVTIEEEITWTEEDAAERRANILKARRRMLGTLVALTLIAFVIAVAHVAAIWVVVPPAVMLGGFVLLLREAARSDA